MFLHPVDPPNFSALSLPHRDSELGKSSVGVSTRGPCSSACGRGGVIRRRYASHLEGVLPQSGLQQHWHGNKPWRTGETSSLACGRKGEGSRGMLAKAMRYIDGR